MMVSTKKRTSICFSLEDIKLFSAASHDRNPLHLSEDYARKTPYANPVVFGLLGGLACLGCLHNRPGFLLSKIVLDFPGPMFIGVPYALEITDFSPEKATAKIFDGRRLLLKLVANFRQGNATSLTNGVTCKPPRREPIALGESDLVEDRVVEGVYSPVIEPLRSLIERVGLVGKGVGEIQVAALLWSSYLVGMELPGRQALFSKLSLDFESYSCGSEAQLSYTAKVVCFDPRFNLLRIGVQLSSGGALLAVGELRSFVRPDSPGSNRAVIENLLPQAETLKGKVALVTGASRGLGAAIAQSLALQGCTVLVNFLKSKAEAQRLQTTLTDAPGEIVLLQGDAGNLSWCESVKHRIEQDYGRLNFLICNACPPILPLWLEPNDAYRINDYVSRSLTLMSVPMAVFLDTLAESSGWNVIISSIFSVQTAPADLPHYVSAKCAIEGLARVAAIEYDGVSFLIVRPPKLLTDQTNTPLSSQGAISTEEVAVKIARCLGDSAYAGSLEILDNFS